MNGKRFGFWSVFILSAMLALTLPHAQAQTTTPGQIVKFFDPFGTPTDSVISENAGNIGIATTTPSANLHLLQTTPQGVEVRLQNNDLAGFSGIGFFQSDFGQVGQLSACNSNRFFCTGGANALQLINNAAGFLYLAGSGVRIDGSGLGGPGDIRFEAGTTTQGEKMRLTGDGNLGIGTTTPTARLHVIGDFIATGTKSALVDTTSYGKRQLYAVESPENWFEDFGKADIIQGRTVVKLDPIFAETVSTQTDYHIFLTPRGDCKGLYIANQTATSFEVKELQSGKSNLAFDYRIVAKRKGYEETRLAGVKEGNGSQLAETKIARNRD
jgi:hypothetical protein